VRHAVVSLHIHLVWVTDVFGGMFFRNIVSGRSRWRQLAAAMLHRNRVSVSGIFKGLMPALLVLGKILIAALDCIKA